VRAHCRWLQYLAGISAAAAAVPEPPEELCDMAFLCTLMDDPVVASDGHTYNREEIQKWFKGHDTSPRTNEPFEHKILIPNMAMRQQIIVAREARSAHPVVRSAGQSAGVWRRRGRLRWGWSNIEAGRIVRVLEAAAAGVLHHM